MKIPTMLLKRVLLDVGLQLSDSIDIDYREICSRYEHEGMSFLTITLPLLDDALLRGLSRGYLTRDDFKGFRPFSKRGNLPALLSGFFRRVFDTDGSIKGEPDVCAIFAIRQVARLFKKVELPCSDQRINAAYERYISNDREVDWRRHRVPMDARLFASICDTLWSDLEDFSETLFCFPGIFGVGATAERKKRNERHSITEWPERAENSFPSAFHAVFREDSDGLKTIRFIPEEQEQPVRVVQVPKTLKTPRTISVEPSYMMLMQQSIARPLMMYLESKRFGYRSIRFIDQSVNANLARLGSIDGSYATIDLKDASDMVDNDLVREIFERPCPTFHKLIQDCRSTRAQLPDGSIIPLKKFASMGSALCFPIESMVFFTIVVYAIVKRLGKVPSKRCLREIARNIAIYGDDIIVEGSMAGTVMETLTDFGLKVNHDKSFHSGLFRESCGGDYYNGVDVTPTYVRHWDDTGTLRVSSHKVAYVALSNTFYMKGLWHASQYLRDEISLRLKHHLPYSRYPIGVLHWSSFIRSTQLCYDSKVHGYRVKGFGIRVRKDEDSPSGLDGFLSLAFGSRYFQETMARLRSDLRHPASMDLIENARREYTRDLQRTELDDFLSDKLGDSQHRLHDAQLLSFENSVRKIGIFGGSTDHFGLLYEDFASVAGSDGPSRWFLYPRLSTGEGSGGSLLSQPSLKPLSVRLGLLDHLGEPRRSSLYASDRPHALCLKRGWTATPAGLQW